MWSVACWSGGSLLFDMLLKASLELHFGAQRKTFALNEK
jgi:hypothetical protein